MLRVHAAWNRKRLKFYDKDPIDWPRNLPLNGFYKTLLELHSNHPALRSGDPDCITYWIKTNHADKLMAYLRQNGGKEVLVLLNFSETNDLVVDLLDEKIKGEYKDVFSGSSVDPRSTKMQAWSYFVFEK